MTTQFPIGHYFEIFVVFLKNSFGGFFYAINATLSFVINTLKQVLLIDPDYLYTSILFGVLISFLLALLVRRKRPRWFLPAFLIFAILFAGVESWRLNVIHRTLDREQAEKIALNYERLNGLLENAREELVPPSQEQLHEWIFELDQSAQKQSKPVKDTRRVIANAQRKLRNVRSKDLGKISKNLQDIKESVHTREILRELPPATVSTIDALADHYEAVATLELSKRMLTDLRKIEQAEPIIRFMNSRSYERLQKSLEATKHYFSIAQKTPSLVEATVQTKQALKQFNPTRLNWYAPAFLIIALVIIALLIAGRGVALFSIIGFILIVNMGLWHPTMESLALVLAATLFALLCGIPLGIAAVRSQWVNQLLRPLLDLMQTMPAFVYLIPAVIFFGLGEVPGAMATLIFSMPPAVRLTTLGIRQVPEEIVEAAQSFGSTSSQILFKAQLPIALPTILAGVNQTIMLSLSMVVIAGMIGAGGLGNIVLTGITQMKLGLGFEGGLAVVILAIYLDRVTQAMGNQH